MIHSFSFPKSEHLCHKNTFDELFEKGKTIHGNGLRIVWLAKDAIAGSLQVAVSVSKRNFKRAVHRNVLKRRLREAFRLHAQPLRTQLTGNNISVFFIMIYTRKDIKEYREIEENVIHSLSKLEHELTKWKQNNANHSLAIENGSDTID